MLQFHAHEWTHLKKDFEQPIGTRHTVHINCCTTGQIKLYGKTIRPDETKTEKILLGVFERQMHLKTIFNDFTHICVEVTEPGSIRVKIAEREVGEPLNSDPPPEVKVSTNPLTRLQQQFRQDLGMTRRETFMEEDQNLTTHEVEDDAEFEEEQLRREQEETNTDDTAQQSDDISSTEQTEQETQQETTVDPNTSE